MNPVSNEQFGLNLPSPVAEHQPVSSGNYEVPVTPIETRPIASEADPTRIAPKAPAYPIISLPPMPTAKPTINNVVATTTLPVVPITADDRDLIEKEWVKRAKRIVHENRDDPYKQSKELTLFKADYIQKRYNKIIKLSE